MARVENSIIVPGLWGRGEVALAPRLVEGSPKAPIWLFLAPTDGPADDIMAQVAHSIIRHGDAVFLVNRYAIYDAERQANGCVANLPVEVPDDWGRDISGMAIDFPAPKVIQQRREAGWPIRESSRTAYLSEYLAGEIRSYSLASWHQGGQIAAQVHLVLAQMGASKANKLLWSVQALTPKP